MLTTRQKAQVVSFGKSMKRHGQVVSAALSGDFIYLVAADPDSGLQYNEDLIAPCRQSKIVGRIRLNAVRRILKGVKP